MSERGMDMRLKLSCTHPSSISVSQFALEISFRGSMRRYSLFYPTITRPFVFSRSICSYRHIHSIIRALPILSASQPSPPCNTQYGSLLCSYSSAIAAISTLQEEYCDFSARETPNPELDEGSKNLSSPYNSNDISPERKMEVNKLIKAILPHKDMIRQLDIHRNWITREDVTYMATFFMEISESDALFKLYKWSHQQTWYKFEFSLATKVADQMGKEGKFFKCRDIFNHIINHRHVPSKTTFHILTLAYIKAPVKGTIDEACNIYNRMIQLGGYQPHLDLHNALFRALISKHGDYSKRYLKQAEFIFHNLITSELEVHRDLYAGLIWLHSYQDSVDMTRINTIREEMDRVGMEETRNVLLSILRACSKEPDGDETERTWQKLAQSQKIIPQPAFTYKMEVYSKLGEPLKSLDIFREMQVHLTGKELELHTCYKIIEVLAKAKHVEKCESLMVEFRASDIKPLLACFIYMMEMYLSLGLHEKLEAMFVECVDIYPRNQTVYNIYMDSLVNLGNIDKADTVFNTMLSKGDIGINSCSCNTILRAYIAVGDFLKAEKIYDLMCQKKYDIDSPLMEKLEYVLSLSNKRIKKPISMKLTKEQREILMGLLLGGVEIESVENRRIRNHAIAFEFNECLEAHAILRKHIYGEFHEWLHPYSRMLKENEDVPFRFCTISHSYFGFYADQFWPRGVFSVPRLIHRWLSPRVLAYWYMYGGRRMPSGDVALKVMGDEEGVGRLVEALKGKSLDCRIKKKGNVTWIGLLGSNSLWFMKLAEPYILDSLKGGLGVAALTLKDGQDEVENFDFEGE